MRYSLVFATFSFLILFNYFFSAFLFEQNKWSSSLYSKEIVLIVILTQLLLVHLFKLNRGVWKYSSITDLVLIIKVAAISFVFDALVSMFIIDILRFIPVLIVNHVLFIFGFGGLRLLVRIYKNKTSEPVKSKMKQVLIVGAGDGGDIACRRIKRTNGGYKVIGFLDDDPLKEGCDIHGVKVLGNISSIASVVQSHQVDEVVIAIPSAGPVPLRTIAEKCFEAKVEVKIMPGLSSIFEEDASFEIRSLKLEDLLAREPIKMDLAPIEEIYKGKRILVTGAAGSIGEELVRQIAQRGVSEVYLLDQAESPLYFLYRECEAKFPNVRFIPLLSDITDLTALSKAFEKAKPQIVLHAAAYKHVPLLEDFVYQAMMVNVRGTKHLADLSMLYNVERFIFISTDKAVNPTNILGASKRMSEFLCQAYQPETKTKFIVVRFGNVIGSQGSVIPLFKKQIQFGGPITVTHPDIKRYFMMIPEAVQLVLFASVLGDGGEIFVLDMGKQVKITDLAVNMIRLCGLQPGKDIKISFTGLRSGEKLFEELYDETEKIYKTKYNKINVAQGYTWSKLELLKRIEKCVELSIRDVDQKKLIKAIQEVVTTYKSDLYDEEQTFDYKQAI